MSEEKLDRNVEKVLEKPKPRFQLRFAHSLELGRSELSLPKFPRFYDSVVTSKFYSIHDALNPEEADEEVEIIQNEITKSWSLIPKNKYKEPVLESQRYGWFEEKFIEINPEIERVHFPKRSSDMVKMQNLLDNAAKDEFLFYKIKSNAKQN